MSSRMSAESGGEFRIYEQSKTHHWYFTQINQLKTVKLQKLRM